MFGIAALGYFINDWADIRSDRKAGKPNKLGELPVIFRTLVLIFLLAVAFIPWIWLPCTKYSLGFILAEILLFLLYSLPPVRLKERGILGPVTDSLYAYVVPCSLAALTFFYAGNRNYTLFPEFMFISVAWVLMVGIRGILFHQIADYQNDINAGVTTLITRIGMEKGERLVISFIPVEIITFLFFLGFLWPVFYLVLPVFLVIASRRYYAWYKDPARDYRKFCYSLLDDFYLDVLPVIVLVHLCLQNPWYLLLLAIHVVIFRNVIKNIGLSFFNKGKAFL